MTVPEWSGRKVTAARVVVESWLPLPCGRCGRTVDGSEPWVVGHKLSRVLRPDLTWEPSNWQPEHRTCSDASAQAAVIEKARADGARAALAGADLPHADGLGQPPLLPISLSAARSGLSEVRDDLRWAQATADAPPWLARYLKVPAKVASPPLAMSRPHPDAVGSYGPSLIRWANRTYKLKLRWWQALCVVRILEHRADGSLCWEEVIMSASRRSGKSVVVRLVALWRLLFAPKLFGEQQLIVHSASTLKIAKEPMRYASSWARAQPFLKVSTNNNNYSLEHADGHRWLVVPPDSTAGLDTCLGVIDEAWAAKPEVVDDDLEPSLMERVSPQLLLISTAHRRATSLMRSRLLAALTGEDDGRTLVLLWAALPTDDPADPATWKRASAHWSPQRERMIAAKYAKALSGQADPEFDDPDPLAGWWSQFMNVWQLRAAATARGEPVVDELVWQGLQTEPPAGAPNAAAIESWYDEGVTLVLARRDGAQVVASAAGHADLPSAVAALKASRFRGVTTVGASLVGDPALKGVRTKAGEARTGPAAAELRRLLAENVVRHDGSPHLTSQVLQLRTLPGPDGPRMASNGRADAVKAMVWATKSGRAARGLTRIVLPSSGN